MRRRPPVRWLVTSFGAQAAAADDMRRRAPVRWLVTSSQHGAATPNPAARKFLVDAAAAPQSRLLLDARVRERLESSRVASVFVAADFVTVTALDAADWDDGELDAEVARALDDALALAAASGAASSAGRRVEIAAAAADDDDDELGAAVRATIDELVRPHMHADGGDIDFYGVSEGGIARVRLKGACVDCPSSTVTLRFMIRNLLCHKFPGEVHDVEDVAATALASPPA